MSVSRSRAPSGPGSRAPGAGPAADVAARSLIRLREPDGSQRDITVDSVLRIGRGAVDGLVVRDPAVSTEHAMLLGSASGLVVCDLGSRNGTWRNGVRVDEPALVSAGDVITIGQSTITVVRVGTAPPAVPTGRPVAGAAAQATTLEWLDADPALVQQRAAVPLIELGESVELAVDPVEYARRLEEARAAAEPEPEPEPAFPNFTERRRFIPIAAWYPVRVLTLLVYLGLCVALFVRPDGGLFFFWRLLIPIMPLVLIVAPGLWRNSCPIAATNQFPRIARFTQARTLPPRLKNSLFVVPLVLFVVLVANRKVLFNTSGPATALLLLAVLSLAFAGGVLFKGKSGWCSQFCPMLPVERLYGQTPFVTLPNAHCQPCVGCTKNCYDFNPTIAYQADMIDPDEEWTAPRRLFAAMFPGIIVGYAAFASTPQATVGEVYLSFVVCIVASIGVFYLLDGILRVPIALLAACSGAVAVSLFYWYQAVPMTDAWTQVTGVDLQAAVWPLRVGVVLVALVWFARTVALRRRFVDEVTGVSSVRVELSTARNLKESSTVAGESVRFLPDDLSVAAPRGHSLLDAAEAAGVALEAGCRMGVCGADPVAVLEGDACLSGVTDDEAKTLRRLGLADNGRMACCARLEGGEVSVSLEVAKGSATAGPTLPVDPTITRVVIIGNGVAGVTTADFVRRNHPACEIHVIAREPHHLYNRMGISRVVYGRTAAQGLGLLGDDWYEEHQITTWLNTVATTVLPAQRAVVLGTGQTLGYDRLVMATGASANVPDLPGWGLPGTAVLREIDDATAIRAYVQESGARTAVVAGAGLLGLEAAHALHELGLRVLVLDRGPRLLGKQCDERASALLATYFEQLGIKVLPRSQAAEVAGQDRVEGVTLTAGITLECGLFVVAAGNRPNVELARDAGLVVNRGIVVDEGMQTSVPGIYAVGDVAEHEGKMLGLWPIATEQAEVAATNLLGGSEAYRHPTPAAILKGVGIDMTSVGEYEAAEGDEVISIEGPGITYRKVVLRDGHAVGGIVLGLGQLSPHLISVVKKRADLTPHLEALRTGSWDVLAHA